MSELTAPVLPDHVKKPNEEEYKKTLEQVNANIEKIQKQFASIYITTQGGMCKVSHLFFFFFRF